MNKNISYDVILDLLVGDNKSERELENVLNFLNHAVSIIRLLCWSQRFKNNQEEDRKCVGRSKCNHIQIDTD